MNEMHMKRQAQLYESKNEKLILSKVTSMYCTTPKEMNDQLMLLRAIIHRKHQHIPTLRYNLQVAMKKYYEMADKVDLLSRSARPLGELRLNALGQPQKKRNPIANDLIAIADVCRDRLVEIEQDEY